MKMDSKKFDMDKQNALLNVKITNEKNKCKQNENKLKKNYIANSFLLLEVQLVSRYQNVLQYFVKPVKRK